MEKQTAYQGIGYAPLRLRNDDNMIKISEQSVEKIGRAHV